MAEATSAIHMARDAVLARMERHQDRLESGKAIDNPLRMSLAAGFVAADMPTRARSLYRAVLQSDPDHEMAAKLAALIDAGAARARNQIDMAQALNAEGEATAAAALLRRVVERNPKSIAAHLGLIDIALSRDQIEAAMKRCDRVLGFAPDNKPVRNRRSIALKRLEATRGEGRTAAPNAHAGAMQRAQALLAAGDAFQADRIFASVLAEEVRGDLRILQQSLMFRNVHSHIKLAYKSTPSYWNAYDGAVPTPIRDILSQIVA